jgi:quinol monooxygenase YgiN
MVVILLLDAYELKSGSHASTTPFPGDKSNPCANQTLGVGEHERDGNLLEGTVNPRTRHAESRQIFVITHVDVDPQFVDQARPVLDTFVNDSASDSGVQTFALLSQSPTTNHFHLVEVFANQQAFDAHVSVQHTLDFRNDLQPFIGAPYDERLYQFTNR